MRTVFAKFLGPAEVAAWGILGSVWDVLEGSTEAIAEAGEVVSAFYLGAGKPKQAKMSAYKSLLLAFVISVLLTSIVFMCAEDLAYWMTDDLVLQQLVIELIPLFGVGNIALAIGSMAWTLVGAQGRYALSTSIGFAGSWCVTVPLSALFSIALNFNLKGQTAAVVIGYMVSGTWNTYILLVSDWQGISEKIIAYNAANDVKLDSDLESDDDDDSDSSSSDARGQQGRNQRESRRDAGEESGGESGGETSLSSAPTPSTATH
jgi:multidrug resistance protein, MATE family